MLGPGRYLLGVVELLVLLVPLWFGAARVRGRLLPRFEGAPAHLVSAVLAVAVLVWCAELLGSFTLFEPLPYLLLVVLVGGSLWLLVGESEAPVPPEDTPRPQLPVRSGSVLRRDASALAVAVALLVALIAVVHFAGGVKTRLGTGMTGFDSTWYHGPFAAGFFQSGDTWHLHFIAPQFLAWFYPANSEVLHAVGMLAFGRDILSPLLNLGWFAGCLVACWCIGRPYRVEPWSLALGAIALSVPALADQAGEARNDLVAIFFLLAAVAIAINAWEGREREGAGLGTGAILFAGLAAGLAAGTKLNYLLAAGVLVLGLAWLAGSGRRWRGLGLGVLAALAGGGYWYLRNLVHTGNPLPWVHHLGPISLPSPGQTLGGREAHSVLGYLANGTVWSDWLLPGLHHGLWLIWPLLAVGALSGLGLAVARRGRQADFGTQEPEIGPSTSKWPGALALAGVVGLAVGVAWLVAPTSASGPQGSPRGFESGLRYLAPALVLGLALLPAALPSRARVWLSFVRDSRTKDNHTAPESRSAPSLGRPWAVMMVLVFAVLAVVVGYPTERHYLANRYRDPSFTTPGLNAAFAWARDVHDAKIGTTSTRQYPLFGTDLSNRVAYIGETEPHGGFEAPTGCRQFIALVNAGGYEYVVASRDRIEPGQSPFPPSAKWLEAAGAHQVLRKPPTVVFRLDGPLDPAACSR